MKRDIADFWNMLWETGLSLCAMFALLNAFAPPQDLPWKPLDLSRPIGAATQARVSDFEIAATAQPEESEALTRACVDLLAQAGVRVQRVPDRDDGGFCVARGLVRITGGQVTPFSDQSLVMQCPLAVRYVIWDRQVLRPSAQAIYGQRVRRLETMGSYSCRRIYGSSNVNDRPSEHARGNALDVGGVTLADGRTVSLLADWDGDGPQGRQGREFLHRLRAGACRVFSTVLTPDYNAAHENHFHLDGAPRPLCA